MKTNELKPAIKARQTKLSKKSSDELIQIILRKDDVEKKLNAQIVSLKGEVNELNSNINRVVNINEDNFNKISVLKKKVSDTEEALSDTEEALDVKTEEAKDYCKAYTRSIETIKSYRSVVYVLFTYAVITTALLILF